MRYTVLKEDAAGSGLYAMVGFAIIDVEPLVPATRVTFIFRRYWLYFQPGNKLYKFRLHMIFLSPSGQMMEEYPEKDKGYFLSYPSYILSRVWV
jgi:hypothetical protein